VLPVDAVALPVDEAALAAKEAEVAARLKALGRVAVAYSGGVDSALLLALAAETLGGGATALTARSASLAGREMKAARDLAKRLGVRHVIVDTDEVADPRYAENTPARCYFCKDVVYRSLADYALTHDLGPLVDGMNRDDTDDHRPGRRAAREQGVLSPLFDAGLRKSEVRHLARRRELPVWSKPAMACLSSRIPYGERVTPEKLARIEAAEEAIADLGCATVRVRHHGALARIEVAPGEIGLLVEHRSEVVAALRRLGFRHVALDLEGYQSGSLNRAVGR
jgi:uncharacterized protein